MSLGTSNRDGGKTSESGHLRALAKVVLGDVIEGLAVSQRAAGVNMSVDVAIGDAFVRRSDGSYAHPVFNDAVYNQVISAADGSNPRRDIIVLYVDYGQTPSTAVSNNTNGVVKIKVVNGTPAGSPVDPNAAAIQASVGSGNPYTILARVRVPAGQTSISNSLIDDLRTLIYSKNNSVPTTAIPDNAVTTPKINNSAVTAPKIDFSTLTLADVKVTSGFSTASGTATQITGLTSGALSITSGTKLKITVSLNKVYNSGSPSNSRVTLWDGTVGSGTQIGAGEHTSGGNNYGGQIVIIVTVSPSAGSHTFNVGIQNVGGASAIIDATSTAPMTLLIERIG